MGGLDVMFVVVWMEVEVEDYVGMVKWGCCG